MLPRIEYLAQLSVSRGCGFAALAILTFFVGLSADMAIALKSAGFLSLITCLTLVLKARLAPRHPYKRTELWVLLRPHERPEPSIAQQIIGTVLRETYLYFAFHAALFSAMTLGGAILYSLMR